MKYLPYVAIVFWVIVLSLALATGCTGERGTLTDEPIEVGYQTSRMSYTYVEIDGMPCVVAVFRSYSGIGITCDWSKWQGQ